MSGQTAAATLRIDREFRSLIPPLSPEEFRQLEANIKADGCRDPLVAWNGILIDGHNRYEICQKHGIEFDTVEHEFADRESVLLWIEENQLGRRNLSDDQRAAIAYSVQRRRSEIAKRERASKGGEAERKKEQHLSDTVTDKQDKNLRPKTDTRAAVAREAKVPERKMRAVAEVAKSKPEMVDKIAKGEISIKQAVKAVKKERKEQAKAAIPSDLPSATDRYQLIHASLALVNGDVADGSVDWIITDPPYPKEFLSVYSDLSAFAERVLKPGGSMLVMVGQSYLPEIIRRLSEKMQYHWTLAYMTPGGQAVQLWDRKVNTFWKPVLWFVKGKYRGDWIGDVAKSDVNDNDKNHHKWGQSESGMADLVERFTYPGQKICDPFVGGGTTGIVAVKMNRLFVGIDVDADAINTTKARLAEVA